MSSEFLSALRLAFMQFRYELVNETLKGVVLVEVAPIKRLLAERTLEDSGGERVGARATGVRVTRRAEGTRDDFEVERCTLRQFFWRLKVAKETAATEGMDA